LAAFYRFAIGARLGFIEIGRHIRAVDAMRQRFETFWCRRVLALRAETLAFYFRQAKIISVGDYYGPARYHDLIADVQKGSCLPYLNQFDIAAVIVKSKDIKKLAFVL
jgi:hypothetical protein